MADAADHAWTIAVATGSTPLPPHSLPLRHSGGGLNVAARHILLALYLHHRDLHLPDPQLPAPQAAALTPEAWADTAPEEIAAYLRITCRQFNTALGRRKVTPYPLTMPTFSVASALSVNIAVLRPPTAKHVPCSLSRTTSSLLPPPRTTRITFTTQYLVSSILRRLKLR